MKRKGFEKARKKAIELVSKMTAYEKISQLLYTSPAIERLGIKEYNWWNEAAHGVARADTATVFPQAIGMAATFDPELIYRIGCAVSDEARAKYNQNVRFNDRGIYKGLTFWAPYINIFRDGRWGRGQETFGEDPFLTSQMGVSYVKGIQGDGEYLKAAACAKHFAVHSGPEYTRHTADAKASLKDMWETYLPAFEACVKAGVAGVMGAYNRTNGEPCCAHSYLMEEVLFGKWGFDGYFVSDCGAISDICNGHHFTDTKAEAAALALKKGCDLNCGNTYEKLIDAYEEDLVTEEDITKAAVKLYTVRALLGEFEEQRPYSDIPYSKVNCEEHRELNLAAALQSAVLLKNDGGFLPIKDKYKRIAVIGPNANSVRALEGNYNGRSPEYVTVAEGVRRVFKDSAISVATGSSLISTRGGDGEELLSGALAAASDADAVVLCLGLDSSIEGEEMNYEADGFFRGDRTMSYLPKPQIKLAEAVCDICDNVVVLVMCGSPADLGEKVNKAAKAVLHLWYPGALGGLAAARLLHGDDSPSGRLPVTFYKGDADLPDISDYSMDNRTYAYSETEPLYPFGFGLSYSDIGYETALVTGEDEEKISLSVTVRNKGEYDVNEKIQVYASFTDSRVKTPRFRLCGVKAVVLPAGCEKTVKIDADKKFIKAVLESGERVTPDGTIILYIGGRQPDKLSGKLSKSGCIVIDYGG